MFFVADLDCDAAQAATAALSASAGPDRAGLKQGLAHIGRSNGLHRLSGKSFRNYFFSISLSHFPQNIIK
jgi:hypothetical protein